MGQTAFTKNSKTILSVDFDRRGSCKQMCTYCYVDNMENIYPAYLDKIKKNNSWAKDNPDNFARQLDKEYLAARKSKSKSFERLSKMPVRIYGSGDYIPEHFDFLSKVAFKFYLISKNLTFAGSEAELNRLRQLSNCTRIVLSFDNENIKNYELVKHLYGQDGIQFAFTGTSDDWILQTEFNSRKFGIFFNIGKKKTDVQFSRETKEACPALAGRIPHDNACSKCNMCWKSSKTRGSDWNQ